LVSTWTLFILNCKQYVKKRIENQSKIRDKATLMNTLGDKIDERLEHSNLDVDTGGYIGKGLVEVISKSEGDNT